MHLITNATSTGKETGGEILQFIKPFKINSLKRNKAMNNKTTLNAPVLKHINQVIETNQMFEQNTHTASNERSSMNSSVCVRKIQNIAKDKSCIRLHVELNGAKVKAVLDTGSPVCIISAKHTQKN